MSDEVLHRVYVDPSRQTGATIHRRGDHEIPVAHELRIVRYEGDVDVYLLHYDEAGKELTDTCHSSIEEAADQAEFEFGLGKDEWSPPVKTS